MATGRKPLPYVEPNLKGVTTSAEPRFQTEPSLTPSVKGPVSTGSLATTMLPDSTTRSPRSAQQDPVWTSRLEGLRNDLAATRLDIQHDTGKQQDVCLLEHIATLEADVRALQQEAEQWRMRCLESERDRATAVASEDRAHMELRDAHERERHLAQQSVELRLHKAEIEHTQAQSHFERMKHESELQQRHDQLRAKDEELKSIREELMRARASSQSQETLLRAKDADLEAQRAEMQRWQETLQRKEDSFHAMEAELQRVRKDLAEALDYSESKRQALEHMEWEHAQNLERERSGRMLALHDAKDRSEALEARVRDLEAELHAANTKHADTAREADLFRTKSEHLDEVNKKLRLDLQDAIGHGVRSGGVPFYHDGPARATAGAEDFSSVPRPPDFSPPKPPPQVRLNPPVSPTKSRMDYPRSAISRRLRREVLTARNGFDRYDDPLASTSYSTRSWGS